NNANHALNRIIGFYSPDNRRVLLSDLAATLKAVVSQRLIRTRDADKRLPAVEILLNTRHVAELIESGRLTEIKEAMEKSLAPGSVTFDQALARLVRERRITREDALAHADSPTNLLWNLENAGDDAAPEPAPSPATMPSLLVPPTPDARPAGPGGPKPPDGDSPSFPEFLPHVRIAPWRRPRNRHLRPGPQGATLAARPRHRASLPRFPARRPAAGDALGLGRACALGFAAQPARPRLARARAAGARRDRRPGERDRGDARRA